MNFTELQLEKLAAKMANEGIEFAAEMIENVRDPDTLDLFRRDPARALYSLAEALRRLKSNLDTPPADDHTHS